MTTATKRKTAKKATARVKTATPAEEAELEHKNGQATDEAQSDAEVTGEPETVEAASEAAPIAEPAAAPAVPAPPPPINETELLHEIETAEIRCEEAASIVSDLKDNLKEAKEVLAGRVAELRQLARRRRDREFQIQAQADAAKRAAEALARADANRPLLNLSAADGNEPWRVIPLDAEFDSQPLTAMKQQGLATFGDWADWVAKGNEIEDLPGIGKVKAEELANKFDEFWAEQGIGIAPEPAEDEEDDEDE